MTNNAGLAASLAACACLLAACTSTESDLAACRDDAERAMTTTRPCEHSAAGPVCEDVARLRLTEQCMSARGYTLDRRRLDERVHSDVRRAWRTAAHDTAVWQAPSPLAGFMGKLRGK